MPSVVGNFLRDQDQLGSKVNFNYKGKAGFGTMLGGALSFLLSLFVVLFLSSQTFRLVTDP